MKNFLLNFRLSRGRQREMRYGMKLVLMLVVMLTAFSPNDLFAQEKSVTLNMTNVSMETLFREIDRKSVV